MTKIIAQSYDVVLEYRKRISLALFIVSVAMAMLYILNVYSVISKTVAIQKVNADISVLNSEVESLDTEYLGLSSKISPENLIAYDMSQGKVSEYISRTSLSTLGMNGSISHVSMSSHEY